MKKIYWLIVLGIASLALLGVFAVYLYWFKFNLGYHVSSSGEVWGQFGDFIGGILNPILSFITILILVFTSIYQQKQNENSEKRESIRRLDDRLYGMLSYQRTSYETSVVSISNIEKSQMNEIPKLFEDIFFCQKDMSIIDSVNFRSSIFVIVRQFYLIIKSIDEASSDIPMSEDEVRKYYRLIINMTDFGLIRLVLLCVCYYKGIAAINYILNNKLFMEEVEGLGFKDYLGAIKERKKNLSID